MNKPRYYLILLCITLLVGVLVDYTHTTEHELIHAKIFRDYGINSTININLFGTSTTIPDNNTSSNCNTNCKLANEQNEIVGYNFAMLFQITYVIIIASLLGQYYKARGKVKQ